MLRNGSCGIRGRLAGVTYPNRSQAVHDPKMLRAIAHPVRNRILTELAASGPMRAADLARELDLPANQMSFHLRQLAKYGLVEEDPEAARDKRDRVWRPASPDGVSINLTDLEKQPGGQAASVVFRQHAASWGHHVVDAAYSDEGRDPKTFRTVTEQAVRLTREEALELAAELDAVVTRWMDTTRGRDPERSTYLWFSVLQPYPGDRT
jgi:DNA-binding transcriptional ArsR family regulator